MRKRIAAVVLMAVIALVGVVSSLSSGHGAAHQVACPSQCHGLGARWAASSSRTT
jgi:hypothetical protein